MINLKTIFLAIFIFVLAGNVWAEDAGLEVEISAQQDEVGNTETFQVDTKVTNTSESVVSVNVWICSCDENWVSDSIYAIIEGTNCDKNFVTKFDLSSGESYEKPLSIQVAVPAEEVLVENVTFRLGFKSVYKESDRKGPEVVWSNPITIQVTER